MEDHYRKLHGSARRLLVLIGHKGPKAVIDNEMKIMTKVVAALAGPDRVRAWAGEVTENILDAISASPTRPDEPPPAPRG